MGLLNLLPILNVVYFRTCFIGVSVLFLFVLARGQQNNEQFQQWKKQYGRSYTSSSEEQQRREYFNSNEALITQHNSQPGVKYQQKLNKFADHSHTELRALNGNKHQFDKNHTSHAIRTMPVVDSRSHDRQNNGNNFPNGNSWQNNNNNNNKNNNNNNQAVTSSTTSTTTTTTTSTTTTSSASTGIPQSIDWRQKGAVTPVSDQGSCGCCWAFSAVEAIEGQVAIKQQKLVPLSKQVFVDCDTSDMGCNGGWVMNAFGYAAQSGLPSEAEYPYTGQQGSSCRSHVPLTVPANSGATPGLYLPTNEDQIAAAVATIGPISVSINADDPGFYFYSSGVYRNLTCDNNPEDVDHAVLIVGYDNTVANGGPYWIVKNSWGTQYGENGYVLMAKGVNQCGIANWAMYPTFIS